MPVGDHTGQVSGSVQAKWIDKMNPVIVIACFVVTLGLVKGDVHTLTAASNSFSQRLYQKIALDKRSVCYSPHSIHLVMSMASTGARGQTETEMRLALDLSTMTNDTINESYRELISQLSTASQVTLLSANAMYANPNRELESQFVSDLHNFYSANASYFDLSAPGGPEKPINDYVEDKTDSQIKDLLQPNSITDQTVLVLINTLFFNATWQKQFSENRTSIEDFTKVDGKIVKVSMMNDERTVNVKRNVNEVDVVELPFRGGRFSMLIALPHRHDGITALEKSLTEPGKLEQLLEGLTPRRVNISIPKFRIESDFKLKQPLIDLGMAKAFDENQANFEGISRKEKMYISEVIHKAMIDVSEKGTMAAAASAVQINTKSGRLPADESFEANRSFLIVLQDRQTKQILFQGKYCGE